MARLSIRASDTILSSYRVQLPRGSGSAPGGLPIALPRLDNLPGLRDEPDPRRKRLWELDPTLHCSIIGTCLTQGELREILRRIARRERFNVLASSDHDLHSLGVRLAERRDGPGKLLHKALDRRHGAAIKRFASARDESSLEAQWEAALASGAVPGGYWALLTHPRCSRRLVIRAFGEVHMLSHLVGGSNRADIQRLRILEEENAQLQAELSAQRRGWRHALAERDARVRDLEARPHTLAGSHAAPERAPAPPPIALQVAVRDKLAALEARLTKEIERRAMAEERWREAEAKRAADAERRTAIETEIVNLRAEADALQEQLRSLLGAPDQADRVAPLLDLGGARVLVIGARRAEIAHWRVLVERCSGELLHHDGGVEDNIAGLGGLVSRADIILLPADCVSHVAMWSARRLAAQLGKPFRPMRTASLAAFTHALRETAAASPARSGRGADHAVSAEARLL
jgi:Uncharacterized protein conserved in bacteria (DUF2325)